MGRLPLKSSGLITLLFALSILLGIGLSHWAEAGYPAPVGMDLKSLPGPNLFECTLEDDENHCYIKLKVRSIELKHEKLPFPFSILTVHGKSGRSITWQLDPENGGKIAQCRELAQQALGDYSKHFQFHVWYKKDDPWDPPQASDMELYIRGDKYKAPVPRGVACHLVVGD